MTDTTLPTVDHGAMLKGEIARLDKEIRERQREIEVLQEGEAPPIHRRHSCAHRMETRSPKQHQYLHSLFLKLGGKIT